MGDDSNPNRIPDFSDPRYLDEIGYFLYYEKEARWTFPDYEIERRTYSRLHLDEVLEAAGEKEPWIHDKRVVNVGAGCSCAILAWPCLSKISIDPLLGVYAKLGMLLDDDPDTPKTASVIASAESIPLSEGCCDLAYCRNALDHMHHPDRAVAEIARIIRPGGHFYLDVDLGGEPTPDEPSTLSEEEILDWVEPWFVPSHKRTELEPFSINSRGRVRLFFHRNDVEFSPAPDKDALLKAYKERVEILKRER